jgi:hypothetical protein
MVLRLTEQLVYWINKAKLRAKWLTPCNPLKTGAIVVAVLLPYVVKTPAANAVILAS